MESTTISVPNQTDIRPDYHEYQQVELNLFYTICEVLVAVFAVVGNALVMIVFRKERRLRRRTNYYIVSLAAADFLVGLLGIPFAILSSMGLPNNLHACLFTVSLLVVLCTISIFCLVAVSVDRYWAILHPMGYSRNVRTKTAIVIISICWVAGTIIGFLPLMGWHKGNTYSDVACFFLDVMDYNYLVFLYFGTIITPALLLAAFYAHIYRVVLKQLRQIVTMDPDSGTSSTGCSSGGTMLRMLGAAQKREVKATQNLAIIVLFFMICWIPLYTINCILAFCRTCRVNPTFMFFCIILSHLNSAGNPLLYAYHLRDFRSALKNFILSLFCASGSSKDTNVNYLNNRTSIGVSNNNYNYQNHRFHQYNNGRRRSTLFAGSKRSPLILDERRPPKIVAIVKNSAALAAVASGDINKSTIFRISENSLDSPSSSSPDSLTKLNSSTLLSKVKIKNDSSSNILRQATPFTPHKTLNSAINDVYNIIGSSSSSFEEEDDEVFISGNNIDDKKEPPVSPNSIFFLSPSSMILRHRRSEGESNGEWRNNKISSSSWRNVVSMIKSKNKSRSANNNSKKRVLARSLSDEGGGSCKYKANSASCSEDSYLPPPRKVINTSPSERKSCGC